MKRKELFLDFILGFLLPLIVGFTILYKMFASAGFILYWDVARTVDPIYFIQTRLLYAWNTYGSCPNSITSFLLLMLDIIYDFLGIPTDLAWKLTLLQYYVLAGISMYIAARILFPKWKSRITYYGACCVASLTYMLTTPLISQIIVTPRVISYFAIPLTIAFYIRLLRDDHHIIINSILVAFSLVLLSAWIPLLPIGIAILILYQLYRLIVLKVEGQKIFRVMKKDIVKNAVLATIFGAFYSTSLFSSILMEVLVKPLKGGEVIIPTVPPPPPEKPWIDPQWTVLNVLTLKIMWGVSPTALTTFASFAIPLVAFSTLLIYAKKREDMHLIIFHVILSLIIVVVASQNSPFGVVILSIVRATKASGLWYRFWMEASGYAFLLSYVYSFLAGLFAGALLSHISQKIAYLREALTSVNHRGLHGFIKLTAVTWTIIIILGSLAPWALYSYPVISDVNNWKLNPVVVPQDYYNVNAWLRNDFSFHRVWWLPRPLFIMFGYSWAPTPFTGGWVETVSSKPVLWDSEFTTYSYLLELMEGKSRSIGEALSLAGVKYIALHMDLRDTTLGLGKERAMNALLVNLQRQNDMELIYRDGFIYVFKNEKYDSYIHVPSRIALIVGGYNTFTSLVERQDFDLRDYAVIFTEQVSSNFLKSVLPLADSIFFSESKGLEDLYLQLTQEDFIYPVQYVSSKYSSGFIAGGGDIISLFIAGQRAGKHFNQEGDFLYGSSSVSSSIEGATINITTDVRAKDDYEVWIRVLRSPLGGRLSIYMDGSLVSIVDTNASYTYFKWVKVADALLEPGTHKVTIKNEFGNNVVNVLLIASKAKLDSLRKFAINELSSKDVFIVKRLFIAPMKSVDQSATDPNLSGNELYGGRMVAQSFTPKVSTISGVGLYKCKIGNPNNLVVELRPADENGMISPTVLARAVIPPEYTTPKLGRFDYVNLTYNELEPGRKYWIVIYQEDYGGDTNNYYNIAGIPNVYPDGSMFRSDNRGSSWTEDPSRDLFFQTYFIQEEETYDLEKAAYSRIFLYSWDVRKNDVNEIKNLSSPSNNAKILNFTMPFPGRYIISVNASKPFILVIPESYNSFWRVTNIKDSLHFPAYSFLNGYYINKTGTFQIIVEYAMNMSFEVSKWISISSMIILPILAAILEIKCTKKHR